MCNILLVIVGRESTILISRLNALDVWAHWLQKRIFEVFAHHVCVIVTEILPVRRLDIAAREVLTNGWQVALVVVNARGELCRLLWLCSFLLTLLRVITSFFVMNDYLHCWGLCCQLRFLLRWFDNEIGYLEPIDREQLSAHSLESSFIKVFSHSFCYLGIYLLEGMQ